MNADVTTDAEQRIAANRAIQEARTRLRGLEDKAKGIVRMRRNDFDALSHVEQETLSSSIVAGTTIIED